MMVNNYLVGGIPTPLKNMSSSVGMIVPYNVKNKKCSKPPTSYQATELNKNCSFGTSVKSLVRLGDIS